MNQTRHSLLVRARAGSAEAWQLLTDLYRPLIAGWLRRHGASPQDVDDLTQDVLITVVTHLAKFDHSGRPGAFRAWLRTLAINRVRNLWRSTNGRQVGTGGNDFQKLAGQLEDPSEELSRRWDEEHDRYLLRCLLDLVEREFEPATMRAFRRLTLDGVCAADVARELGISVAAVYVAKSRVLKRIREEAEGLID